MEKYTDSWYAQNAHDDRIDAINETPRRVPRTGSTFVTTNAARLRWAREELEAGRYDTAAGHARRVLEGATPAEREEAEELLRSAERLLQSGLRRSYTVEPSWPFT
jgi:hypothetical protein